MASTYRIDCGNNIDLIKDLEDNSIDCVVTSPPYYGLRDYGTAIWVGGDKNCKHWRANKGSEKCNTGHKTMMKDLDVAVSDAIYKKVCKQCGAVRVDNQLGLEETPEEYVGDLVKLFREIKRVLKDDGTVWLNLGDSYVDKNLEGIPWLVALALKKDGWYLRQDIIWHKSNPMPEPVKDRFVKSHEYIFLLTKSEKYYFDYLAVQETATGYDGRHAIEHKGSNKYADKAIVPGGKPQTFASGGHDRWQIKVVDGEKEFVRNRRDVWTIPTKAFDGGHFATFPEKLVEPCIKAGCREGGIVLDPFSGAATTGVVCRKLDRNYIGFELNPEYVEISKNRLAMCLDTDKYELVDKVDDGKVKLFD